MVINAFKSFCMRTRQVLIFSSALTSGNRYDENLRRVVLYNPASKSLAVEGASSVEHAHWRELPPVLVNSSPTISATTPPPHFLVPNSNATATTSIASFSSCPTCGRSWSPSVPERQIVPLLRLPPYQKGKSCLFCPLRPPLYQCRRSIYKQSP
jgi:hypothetical protein